MLTESKVKRDLVYAYQILFYLKLDDHTYTHLSVRSEDQKSFYIYPFGMSFDEVDERSLMKVSFDGNVIEGKEYQYNRTGYIIHGFVYQARKDIQAIFHLHTPSIVAVSSLKDGLLPISQWALHFYNQISYHNYNSLALSDTEGKRLIADLKENFVMLMRNHGSITCGQTIQEAMFYTYHLERACKTQCLTLAMNKELSIPSEEICSKAVKDLLSFESNLGERDWHAWVGYLKVSYKRLFALLSSIPFLVIQVPSSCHFVIQVSATRMTKKGALE